MNNEQEPEDADLEFVENLIFDCAVDAGFRTDGENYFAGQSGEVDITEQLFQFTALIAEKIELLYAPNTKAQ